MTRVWGELEREQATATTKANTGVLRCAQNDKGLGGFERAQATARQKQMRGFFPIRLRSE